MIDKIKQNIKDGEFFIDEAKRQLKDEKFQDAKSKLENGIALLNYAKKNICQLLDNERAGIIN